jgi:hypothetical protein
MMKGMLFAAPLLLALAPPVGATDPAAERGQAELAPFKQQLMGALKAGLAEGPDQAIDACRVEAPAIAAGLTTEQVRLGRTSHRLRNPDNAGPAWVTAVLQDYLDGEGGWQPRVVQLPANRTGYVEPIVTQPLCLTCHGTDLAPPVASALETLYPEDQATGFAVGDLRGVFWVSFGAED